MNIPECKLLIFSFLQQGNHSHHRNLEEKFDSNLRETERTTTFSWRWGNKMKSTIKGKNMEKLRDTFFLHKSERHANYPTLFSHKQQREKDTLKFIFIRVTFSSVYGECELRKHLYRIIKEKLQYGTLIKEENLELVAVKNTWRLSRMLLRAFSASLSNFFLTAAVKIMSFPVLTIFKGCCLHSGDKATWLKSNLRFYHISKIAGIG